MAAVNYTRGVKLVLKVRLTDATPAVFTPLCTMNAERGITFNAQTNDATIPDCTNPDQIAFLAREKFSLSVDVTGGGMNHKNDTKAIWEWWKSPESMECQMVLDDDDADNVITYEGNFHLTQYDHTGNVGEKVNSTMTLASDGEVTATFGSAVGGA